MISKGFPGLVRGFDDMRELMGRIRPNGARDARNGQGRGEEGEGWAKGKLAFNIARKCPNYAQIPLI